MTPTPTTTAASVPQKSLGTLLQSAGVMQKLNSVLGNEKKAAAFASSVLSVANGNNLLRNADPMTVLGSAMVAATLDLSVVPTLGMAYIVPYKGQASFQIGWRGLVELALRSGQYRNVIVEEVREGELVYKNKFTGEYVFDEDKKVSDKVIGYMANFQLVNGFSKTIYWTVEEVKAHAMTYSQAYRSGFGSPWKTNFDAMAKKTVLKSLISKFGPKSLQMQQAVTFDQATIKPVADENGEMDLNIDAFEHEYSDNPDTSAVIADAATEAAKKHSGKKLNTDLFDEAQEVKG
jgi:recombination protein RecT